MEPQEISDYRAKTFKKMIFLGIITIFLMGIANLSINFFFSSAQNTPNYASQILDSSETRE